MQQINSINPRSLTTSRDEHDVGTWAIFPQLIEGNKPHYWPRCKSVFAWYDRR